MDSLGARKNRLVMVPAAAVKKNTGNPDKYLNQNKEGATNFANLMAGLKKIQAKQGPKKLGAKGAVAIKRQSSQLINKAPPQLQKRSGLAAGGKSRAIHSA